MIRFWEDVFSYGVFLLGPVLMTFPTPFDKKLADLRNLVNQQVAQALRKPEPISLYEPMRYTLDAGGKRLRPLLVLLACEAVGGKARSALDAAVAVELLHNFTLIHDDVMDQDDTRRGQPTVHRKWDINVAILAGDGLVALSYDYLLRTKYSPIDQLGRLFSQALLEVCEGQALDKEYETRDDVTISEYLFMIEKKTAALLALCCELGGYIGGGSQKVVAKLQQFGYNLGIAFQVQDDLLDIMAEEEHLGKTWGSDIKHKKKTMLLILAQKYATPADRATIAKIIGQSEISTDEILCMKTIFERTGTIEHTRQLSQQHFEQARSSLSAIESDERRFLLEQFLDAVLVRTY